MDPVQQLASTEHPPTPEQLDFPAAADWLKHPEQVVERVTLSMFITQLEQEPEWTGPEEEECE